MGCVSKFENDQERLDEAASSGKLSYSSISKMVLIQRDSVLDCGGPPPLWHCRPSFKSASRRRAGAALWRAAKAEGLAQSKTWRQFERVSVFSASLCLVLSPLRSLCSFAAE
jgi:hypothetical protein